MKTVVINQFFGLGDLLFIEPIYRHYFDLGHKVIAPVNKDSLWIQEYIPYVEFVDVNTFKFNKESPVQVEDGNIHVPLRFAHPIYRGYDLHYGDDRGNWMPDKYRYLNLDVELWRTLKFNRNEEKENKLVELLNLPDKYNFVNENFGGSFERVNININSNLPIVNLQKIEGFTMLDWGKVIEGAENIYTVETSIIYYIESLKTKAKEFHLYPRLPFLEDVNYMKELLGDKWTYHDKTNI